eukprot:g11011.t1
MEGTTLGMSLSISNGALDTTLGSVKFVKEGIYQGFLLPKIAGKQLSTLTYTTESDRVEANATIIVMPGEANALQSYIQCPKKGFKGTKLICSVYWKDAYGNSLSYIDISSLRIDASGCDNPVWLGFDSFEVDLHNVNVSTVALYVFKSDRALKVGQTQEVVNKDLPNFGVRRRLSGNNYGVKCPLEVVAGASFYCDIDLRQIITDNLPGNLLVQGVKATIKSSGVSKTSQGSAVHVGNGQYRLRLSILRRDHSTIQVTLFSTNVGSTQRIRVRPADISIHHSRFNCYSRSSLRVGSTAFCFVELLDQYNNARGTSMTASAIETIVERNGIEESRFTNTIYMGTGTYMVKFSSVSTGSILVKIKYKGDFIASEKSHVFLMLPGKASVAESTVDCPKTILGSVRGFCKFIARDQYRNPTDFHVEDILHASVAGPNGLVPTILVTEDILGNYKLMYDTFLQGDFNISISSKIYTTRALSSKTAESQSRVNCLENVEFGGALACTIFTHDVHGNATQNEYDKYGFDVRVAVSGVVYRNVPVAYIAQNRFLAQVPARKAGSGAYFFRFKEMLQSHHRILLSSRRKLHAALGSYQSVKINCGPASEIATISWCTKTVVAGQTLKCWIVPRDSSYGRSCESNDVLFELSALPAIEEFQNASNTPKYLTRSFARTDAGITTLQVMLRRENLVAVGDAMEVNVVSGPVHTLQTACPEDAIWWSYIVCSLETSDVYGNAAEYTFRQVQKNFHISMESANMSFTTVTKGVYKIKYYVSPVSSQFPMHRVVVSSIFGNKNWTVMLRSTDINSIDVTCPTEVVAGVSLSCTISARNTAGILYGNESEAFGFSISILSNPSGRATEQTNNYVVRNVKTGIYQITPTISKTGAYYVQVFFKNKNITAVSSTFEVKYASISHTRSFSSCPQRSAYMSRIVCAVVLYDTYGNLYGKNLSAAVSHKLEISGTAILHGVVTYVSPGHYDVVYTPSITGSAVISTKYDEISFVTDKSPTIDIEAGAPVSFSVDCPEVAILNSTYLCTLNASDRYGHLTSAGKISVSNVTIHSTRYTEVVQIADPRHTGIYKVFLRTTEPGSYPIKLFNSNVVNVTIIPTNISLNALDISCFNSTIFAGQTFSCEVVHNNGMRTNSIEARGFTTVVNKISNGVTQTSFSNFEAGNIAEMSNAYQIYADLREAGEYQISLFFANLMLFQDKKVTVLADEKVHMLLLDCPAEIFAGVTFSCNASTNDKYGNVGGNQEDLEALSVHAYDEESGKNTECWAKTMGEPLMQSIEITIDECEAGEDTDATGKGDAALDSDKNENASLRDREFNSASDKALTQMNNMIENAHNMTEIIEFAKYLGIDPSNESSLLWIAQE